MILNLHCPIALRSLAVSAVVLIFSFAAQAQTFKVLYSFTGGSDGGGVYGGVVMDKQGNLFGTTSGGGTYGDGTVFKLSPNSDGTWTQTVLYSFANGDPNGQEPQSTLILDEAGNPYGTAGGGIYGGGTAFELTPGSGGSTVTVLYSFGGHVGDTNAPASGLTFDAHGNLYGAGVGGAICCGGVVELSPGTAGWTEDVFYSFGANGGSGGLYPAEVIVDATGTLYGATYGGGDLICANGSGCGTAYKLRHSPGGWKESLLHTFGSFPRDGRGPSARLTFDPQGHLYGTTVQGGIHTCFETTGCGTVFRLTQSGSGWKESIIHQFGSGAGGSTPAGALTIDGVGRLYGAAEYNSVDCGCGLIYRLTPGADSQWTYNMIHTFAGTDGALPTGGMITDANGNLFGTTVVGGPGGYGVVFEITP